MRFSTWTSSSAAHRHPWRLCCANEGGQLGEGSDLAIRSTREAFSALAVPVAPDDPHPESGGSISVPRIRRQKGDGRRRDAEPLYREPIDLGMGLVDADLFDRQNDIKQLTQLGAFDD